MALGYHGKIHVIGKRTFVRHTSKKGLREDRVLQTVVVTKTQRRADELVALVRLHLKGHYARVPITIERDGNTRGLPSLISKVPSREEGLRSPLVKWAS